jgi:hypothetical protein
MWNHQDRADYVGTDTTTFSSYSLSGTLELESPVCCCGSPMTLTRNHTSQLSASTSYVVCLLALILSNTR